eukprot:10635743-Alexandrium_andersonii.AAC.1
MCSWDERTINLAHRARSALAAHAEPRCLDDGHKDPRKNADSNDDFAVIVARGIPRVPVAVIGAAGLC